MVTAEPPPPPRPLVHRPRLLDLLDTGVRGPLTVVSGPAGAGKTTLVADWARAHADAGAGSVVWVSVREPAELASWASELTQRRSEAGADPLVIVVDGLQRSALAVRDRAAEPALAARLTALLRERAGTLRLVLCTRGEPPLPLGRARLEAGVVEIGPDELAFTWEEARALLAPRLPDDTARARWRAVEGWAAGLAQEPGELPGYLRRELLDGLGDEQRDFLLRVSVVEQLTPALATALTGAPDAAGTLDRLARAHALVTPLDRNGGAYRLAPPLRDALRAALPTALPGAGAAVAELHRRAAGWLTQAGDPLAAARHALAAGAPQLAADVLAGAWLDLLAQGREVEVAELLAAMPPATLAADPELRIVAGALASAREAVAQALDRQLDEASAGLAAGADDAGAGRSGASAAGASAGRTPAAAPRESLPGTLAAARLRLARLEGDVATAMRAAAELAGPDPLAQTAADGGDGIAAQRRRRTLALQQLGITELVAGRADSSAAHLEQALGMARAGGFDHLAVACLGPLAALDAQRGRLRSARAWGEQAVALAAGIADRRASALVPAHAGLAVVAWLRDERCAADAELRRAEAALAADGQPHPLGALALRIPAAWLAAAGEPGEPDAELARLEAAAADAAAVLPRLPDWLLLALDEARVRLLLAVGRPGAAAQAASAPQGARRCERLLLGAHVALAREDPAEARRLAGRFLADAMPDVRPVHVLEAMLLQAATTYELGTVWEALSWLERAVAAAAEERCRRPFAEGGQPVRALLRVLARRGPWPPVGFVAELLDERPVGEVAPSAGEPSLSEREQAVLRYLPSSLSKREIASELGVSANTVKTHVSAIYRKLAVGTRSEAVARARELGLLGGGLSSVWEG